MVVLQSSSITPLTTPKTLASLRNWGAVRGIKSIQLQAPSANTLPINYGGHDSQLFELAAGATSVILPIAHLNDLKVLGNGINTLRVLIIS